MKKYYIAKQIAPEYQESPLQYEAWENVSFMGNDRFVEQKTPILEEILDCIDDACRDYYELVNNPISSPYSSIAEIVKEYFPSSESTTETEWEEVFTVWPDSRQKEERNILCNILSSLTGKKYEWKQIRGICQSDWQYIYYPANEYSNKDIETLEAEYFNTGEEWLIFEEPVEIEESEKESACEIAEEEDFFTFSTYVTSWNDEEKRMEIADAIGCKPDEVLLFSFDHYVKQPVYKLA